MTPNIVQRICKDHSRTNEQGNIKLGKSNHEYCNLDDNGVTDSPIKMPTHNA